MISTNSDSKFFFEFTLYISFLIIYFLPTIIAAIKAHKSIREIFIVNCFLSFFVVPWFHTLYMALKKDYDFWEHHKRY